ncbi:MAG: DUF6569 family protein [Planctomycetota bacterium]|nr:DUF6569 family protein [Planctomycetota bacterium]
MMFPKIQVQKKIHVGGLSVFPLVTKKQLMTKVKSGMTMIAKGKVCVEEVDESGHVPTLFVRNSGNYHVLFLEGDQLVGAKQNRICNSSLLIAPQSHARIPVSCVERGRWHHNSKSFSPSPNAATPSMRSVLKAAKLQPPVGRVEDGHQVPQQNVHQADQGKVWAEVDRMETVHCSASQTNSMDEVFAHKRQQLTEYRKAMSYVPGAMGWVIAIGGSIRTVDLFGKRSLCKKAWTRILRGSALEAMASSGKCNVDPEAVGNMMQELQNLSWKSVNAVSAGEEYVAVDKKRIGSSLMLDRQLVHLSVVV